MRIIKELYRGFPYTEAMLEAEIDELREQYPGMSELDCEWARRGRRPQLLYEERTVMVETQAGGDCVFDAELLDGCWAVVECSPLPRSNEQVHAGIVHSLVRLRRRLEMPPKSLPPGKKKRYVVAESSQMTPVTEPCDTAEEAIYQYLEHQGYCVMEVDDEEVEDDSDVTEEQS